jgi:hypothetical protein
VSDSDGDGFVYGGEEITISATRIQNVGGCVNGVSQYRFTRDGVLVQDWSSDATFIDHPLVCATYKVQARCSQDTDTCTSASLSTAANKTVQVIPGNGADITIDVAHGAPSSTAVISWASVPQNNAMVDGYDVYLGTIDTAGDPDFELLTGIACLALPGGADRVPQPPGAPGPLASASDSAAQTIGKATYYLVGHNPVSPTCQVALGLRTDREGPLGLRTNRTIRTLGPACP